MGPYQKLRCGSPKNIQTFSFLERWTGSLHPRVGGDLVEVYQPKMLHQWNIYLYTFTLKLIGKCRYFKYSSPNGLHIKTLGGNKINRLRTWFWILQLVKSYQKNPVMIGKFQAVSFNSLNTPMHSLINQQIAMNKSTFLTGKMVVFHGDLSVYQFTGGFLSLNSYSSQLTLLAKLWSPGNPSGSIPFPRVGLMVPIWSLSHPHNRIVGLIPFLGHTWILRE